MRIDWFTVIAQVLNFLLLVWLLKKFLYQPVLRAIDAREKKIAGQLDDAAAKEAEASRERDLYNQKNATFDQQREASLNKLNDELNAKKQEQLEQIRKEIVVQREKWQQSVREEQQSMGAHIRDSITHEVFAIAEKVMADLGAVSLEDQILDRFIRKLNNLDDAEKKKFQQALGAGNNQIQVVTAFPLSDSHKKGLVQALGSLINPGTVWNFIEDPSLIGGIELRVRDYHIAWNIDQYVEDLKWEIKTSNQHANEEEVKGGE